MCTAMAGATRTILDKLRVTRASPTTRTSSGASATLRPLYVDVANFMTSHFFTNKRDWWACIESGEHAVQAFLQAAHASGFHAVPFVDAATATGEAAAKWRARRQKEVLKARKNVPQGASVLLADAFQLHGAEPRFSFEADNDDTLAAYAHADHACVLSSDRDFFRYIGAQYQVFSSFEIRDNSTLVLLPANSTRTPSGVEPRALQLSPLPATARACPSLTNLVVAEGRRTCTRGVPTPLVRAMGNNPHEQVCPLRQALYAHLGMGSEERVLEEWPMYMGPTSPGSGTGTVVWTQREVGPDATLLPLLFKPADALEAIFPAATCRGTRPPPELAAQGVSQVAWNNHVFALHALVFEVCCVATGDSLLRMLLDVGRARRALAR